jgi:hypothetical protein
MKKIALIGLVSLCSIGAYAQGTVLFYGYAPANSVEAAVYSPQLASPTTEVQGDTAQQLSDSGMSGTTQVYTGVAIGGASYTGGSAPASIGATSTFYQYGNLFTAELYAISTTTSTAIPAHEYQSSKKRIACHKRACSGRKGGHCSAKSYRSRKSGSSSS